MITSFQRLKKIKTTVWVFLILIILIRMALPSICKYAINWTLENKIESYQGHIQDFDLALWRGAYQVEGLKIWKKTVGPEHPLLAVKKTDISLAWRALWHGRLLGDLRIDGLKANFTDSENKKKQQFGTEEKNWQDAINALVPIDLESLVVTNSSVHFTNRDFKVPVDIYVDQINAQAKNLRNMDNKKELLPSSLHVRGQLLSEAAFNLNGGINLVRKPLALDIQAELKKVRLKKFNPFFMAYGPFSFENGVFSFYSEVAANKNKIKGYFKPFFADIKMTSPHEHYVSLPHALNELALGTTNFIFRNSNQKVATKFDFEGDFHEPDVQKWRAFWLSLKNAFVKPLQENIEKNIQIRDVPKS